MEEAEIFSTAYLKEAVQKFPPPVLNRRWGRGLDKKHLKQIIKENLSKQVAKLSSITFNTQKLVIMNLKWPLQSLLPYLVMFWTAASWIQGPGIDFNEPDCRV